MSWCGCYITSCTICMFQTRHIVPPSVGQYWSFKRKASCTSSRRGGGRKSVVVVPAEWVLSHNHQVSCCATLQYYQHAVCLCSRMTLPRAQVLQMSWAWPMWVVCSWYWWGAWAWHVSLQSASLCGSLARWPWKRGWGTYCKTPSGNFTLSHYAALTLLYGGECNWASWRSVQTIHVHFSSYLLVVARHHSIFSIHRAFDTQFHYRSMSQSIFSKFIIFYPIWTLNRLKM